jgi:hypothetical protein
MPTSFNALASSQTTKDQESIKGMWGLRRVAKWLIGEWSGLYPYLESSWSWRQGRLRHIAVEDKSSTKKIGGGFEKKIITYNTFSIACNTKVTVTQ